MLDKNNTKIAVIGLGYVGLPLAHAFSYFYKVVGFDTNSERITELNLGIDKTHELSTQQLKQTMKNGMLFTEFSQKIEDCNIYIITVPTPIDKYKKPDISFLIRASELVGKFIGKEDIVIYESTVYPGCTEEDCVPVLERVSGLRFNTDFYCGYSPERINPGDKEKTITKIPKITSGSTPEVAQKIDALYNSIIIAGTHMAPSIKVAEAAKVIENIQRDLNISLVNELAVLFDKMNIDTLEVLEAAGTKWNFLNFRPGLVGGHCIGVDPFYLTHKAESLGYKPHVIHSGRLVNDSMGEFIAHKLIKLMINNDLKIKEAKALVLGVTFKENCPDIRNSKVFDVIKELSDFGVAVDIYDPIANPKEIEDEYHIKPINSLENKTYDAIVFAVGHKDLIVLDFEKLKRTHNTVIYDVKSVLPKEIVTDRL